MGSMTDGSSENEKSTSFEVLHSPMSRSISRSNYSRLEGILTRAVDVVILAGGVGYTATNLGRDNIGIDSLMPIISAPPF